jgi:hypothetical protein
VTTIADVRVAIAGAIDTISGLVCFPYESDIIKQLPAAFIGRGSMNPDLVLSGTKQAYAFTVMLYTQRTLERQAQVQLDAFCDMAGALSIRTAAENETLYTANLVHYVEVKSVSETMESTVAGVPYFVVKFELEAVW